MDLSRTIRLSGLPSGAKLDLVVVSRSPSVVSVALQVPESDAQDIPDSRLTDKFPSTTTLWQILRRFESGTAGGLGVTKKFTARGVPQAASGNTGAGRLYHEQPVLQVVERELSSFTDLQKSLNQLGFNSGSVRIRLSFRTSATPIEEAITQIDQYFKSIEAEGSGGTHSASVGLSDSKPDLAKATIPDELENSKTPPEPLDPPDATLQMSNETHKPSPATTPLPPPSAVTGPSQRPISVFAPPSSSTPQAARQSHNEADYEPSIDHARLHQNRLNASSRNQRLLTDAEQRAQQEAQAQKLAEIKEVDIKVRFPDQTQVVCTFSSADTADELYYFVQNLLETPTEDFSLNFRADEGVKQVPRNSKQKLIKDLGIRGRMMLNFVWNESVDVTDRALKGKLKPEYMVQAKEHEIKEVEGMEVKGEGGGESAGSGPAKQKGKEKGKGGMFMKSFQKHLSKK